MEQAEAGLLSSDGLREPHRGITLGVLVVELHNSLISQVPHQLPERPEPVVGLGERGILAEQRSFEARCPDVAVAGPDEPGQRRDDESVG